MSRAAPALDRFRHHWPPVALFALLSALHTWPLAVNPAGLSHHDNSDTLLNEWILAWINHQLLRDPARLFDGNIFYPARDTLAFSEPLIVPALMGAPVFWLGGSPVLAFNLLLLAGFTLTGVATYAVVFAWTRDRAAGLVAGSLFAFSTHTLTRLAHLQAIHAYGLPLALFLTDRLVSQPRVRTALWLAGSMALLAYTSGYLFVFGSFIVGIAVAARVADWRPHARGLLSALGIAILATALMVLPLALPYRRVAIEQGLVRSLESVREFSATVTGYLATASRIHVSTWSGRFFDNPVDAFFPGAVGLGLAGFAVWASVRWRAHRARAFMLGCLGLTGFVLSLGPQTPIYVWAFRLFPPMQGLRAAARFGSLWLLAIAILAGLGLAVLGRRASPRRATWIGIAAVVLVNAEALRAPFEFRRFDGIPGIYEILASEPGPVVLVETPFYPAQAAFENAEYVLNSTAHWRPLMNGYSGYTPASYRNVAWTFWYFPREHAIQAMRAAGVTHFTVHPERFGNEAEQTLEILSKREDVERVAISARTGIRLYRFR